MVCDKVLKYCSNLTLHQLFTLALILYSSADKLKPLVKLAIARLSALMLRIGAQQAKTVAVRLRAVLASLVTSAVAKLAALVVTKVVLVSPQSASQVADADVQAAPLPAPLASTSVTTMWANRQDRT